MIKGAIFDMDGTLLDSMGMWDNVGADLLIANDIEPPDDLKYTLRRLSSHQSADYFHLLGVPGTREEIIAQNDAIVYKQYAETLLLKPGAADFLKKLKATGVKICVATATNLPLAEMALRRCGVLDLIDFIITCADVGVGKESPEIFLQALSRLGTPKQQTIVFEDAAHAVATATAAGFRTVAIYDNSFSEEAEEIRSKAEQYLQDFTECALESL